VAAKILFAVAVALIASACGGATPVAPPPVLAIVCPAPASGRTAPGGTSAPVTFAAPTTVGGKAPVTATCSPAPGADFAVGSTTVSCAAVDGAGQSAACTFAVTVEAAPIPQLAYTKFLGFGDSQTEGKVSAVPSVVFPTAYTLKLQSMLQARYTDQTIVVANDGLGGQRVADEETLERFDDALKHEAPQVVMIMDGANDLYGLQNDGIGPAIDAIATLGARASARGVQVLLGTLPPMDPAKLKGAGAAAVTPFNAQLAGLAAARNWTLVDVNAAFKGDLSLIGADGLHPTDAGYQVVAQAFYDAIVARYESAPAGR
jgi:lysophospholipase L1-like esterase